MSGPPAVLVFWVLFALGVIPGNLTYWRIVRAVRTHGGEACYLGPASPRTVWRFHRILRAEAAPTERRRLRRLAYDFYLAQAWCFTWFSCFLYSAVTAR